MIIKERGRTTLRSVRATPLVSTPEPESGEEAAFIQEIFDARRGGAGADTVIIGGKKYERKRSEYVREGASSSSID